MRTFINKRQQPSFHFNLNEQSEKKNVNIKEAQQQ